jgi:hypothetical protein
MNKGTRVLIFLTLVIGSAVVSPRDDRALAQQTGCCKVRDALSSGDWRNNGLNLQNCTQLNDKRDGDNVFQPTGLVWWDQNCS